MILGRITGKTTTSEFKFTAEKEVKKFEYIQVYHEVYEYVLCQIVEIEKQEKETIAYCQAIGYKDNGRVKKPRIPFTPGTEALEAEDEFIRNIISLEKTGEPAHIGKLDGKDIDVYLDLNKVLSMHLAVLAKSGSGKSYAVGALLEEIVTRKIPVIVIDPHGEYSSMKHRNEDEHDKEQLKLSGLSPEGYSVEEYGDTSIVHSAKPLKLSNPISQDELMHLIPGKMSNSQTAILYSSLKHASDFDSLLLALEQEESSVKYGVISMVEYIKSTSVFSSNPTPLQEYVKPGNCTIINLKGMNPDVQEVIVYKLCKDLFEARKKNKVPPFFLVLEEAHNYTPERSFGETKASKTLRNIASEGRKFGLGLCVISQRPARVDKSVLSQCTTQILLKVTNPNDVKAISSSVEGITTHAERELQNLPIGSAMITGITDVPLLVNIRPRKSMHGGKTQRIIDEKSFMEQAEEFEEEDLLGLIKPNMTPKDIKLMSEKPVKRVKVKLRPCIQAVCEDNGKEYKLLIDINRKGIVVDKETGETKKIPFVKNLGRNEIQVLRYGFKKNFFTKENIEQALNRNPENELSSLQRKEYVKEKNGNYSVSQEHVFTKLSKHESHDRISYEKIKYDEKEEAREEKELLENLGVLTRIKEKHECFLATYEPEYEG